MNDFFCGRFTRRAGNRDDPGLHLVAVPFRQLSQSFYAVIYFEDRGGGIGNVFYIAIGYTARCACGDCAFDKFAAVEIFTLDSKETIPSRYRS